MLGLLTKAVKVEKPKYTNYYDEEGNVIKNYGYYINIIKIIYNILILI